MEVGTADTSVLSLVLLNIGAFSALLTGTAGGTKVFDAARNIATKSRLVGPEGWRRGIETLPILLGSLYLALGLLHVSEADALVSSQLGRSVWSFCDQGTPPFLSLLRDPCS
jgi:hypothetical protein